MASVSRRQAMGPVYQDNKTVDFFHAICKVIYFVCGTNFWFEDIPLNPTFMKIHKILSQGFEIVVVVFIISEWGSFFTQHKLTDKQSNDRLEFAFSHLLMYVVYLNVMYHKKEIRDLLLTLCVRLKEVCNDELAEKMMIKTAVIYLIALLMMCCFMLITFGIGSAVQSLTSNATFTTVVVAWPDLEDRRVIAGISRIISYFIWVIYLFRIAASYYIVLSTVICLEYQFKNLCSYFEGLNSIFEGPGTQRDKEERYEDAFKVGIKMHSVTLRCTEQTQLVGRIAFSMQVIINVSLLGSHFIHIMQQESLFAMLPMIFVAVTILVGTGVFMWNAGDVTVEASHLPSAMFHSGWHNCQRGSSVRVRKLVTIAMTQAQKRVAINGLMIFELSYESFVTMVKFSYSLFSVIY